MRRRSPRRRTLWSTYYLQGSPLASGATINANILGGLLQAGVGMVGGTVVRTHVALAGSFLNADTVPGLFWGLIVADPSTSIPAIGVDFYADWLMQRVLVPGLGMSQGPWPAVTPTVTIVGREYDVRARRRIHEVGDQYWLAIKNTGSGQVNYTVLVRTLVALP